VTGNDLALTNAQLDALADQFDMEAEALSRESAVLSERIGLKRRLASDLRQEAENRRNRGYIPLPARTPAATVREPQMAVVTNGYRGQSPSTSEAVLIVLQARSTPATTKEVYDELDRRGWLSATAKSPRSAVKAALWSLGEKGRIQPLGDSPATRRWAAKNASPAPTTVGKGKSTA
jgi:hypothetical protein